MQIIVLLMLLLSGSIFLCAVTDGCFERTIPLTCIGTIAVLFVFGLFGPLTAGVYAVFALAACLYVAAGIVLRRKKTWRQFGQRLLTPAFFVFLVFFFCIAFANRGEYAHEEDEFIHWMLAVKSYIKNDMLITRSHDLRINNDYPPGLTLFQYFLTRVMTLGKAERFVEWPSYMATQLLGMATMFPLLKKSYFQSVISGIMAIVSIFVFPLFFYYNFYSSIYVDGFLGVISGAAMATVLLTPEEEKGCFYHLLIYAECFLILFSKRTGIVMVVFLMGAYLLDLFCREKIDARGMKRVVRPVGGILLAVGVPYVVWKAACRMDTMARRAMQPPVQPLQTGDIAPRGVRGMFQILSSGELGYRKQVIKDFFESFFEYRLSIGTTGIELNFVLVFLLAAGGFYCLYILYGRNRADEKRRFGVMSGYLMLQLIGWFIFFLVCYMFVFSESEGTRLMSFGRYLRTGFMSVYIPLVMAWCVHLRDLPEDRAKIAATVLTGVILMVCPIKELVVFMGNQYPSQADTAYAPVAALSKELRHLPGNGAKVYYVERDPEADPKYSAQMNYYIYPDNIVWFKEAETEAETWLEALIMGEYDYVMIRTLDESFVRDNKDAFAGKPQENRIYRVDQKQRTLVEL